MSPHWSTSMHFCKSSVTGTHPLYISQIHSSVSVVSVDAEGGYDIFYDSIVLGVAGMCAATPAFLNLWGYKKRALMFNKSLSSHKMFYRLPQIHQLSTILLYFWRIQLKCAVSCFCYRNLFYSWLEITVRKVRKCGVSNMA